MAEIIGTYPVINKILSSIDDNGIQTLSYAFTVKTTDAYKYIPSKDDKYTGPGTATIPKYQTFAASTNTNASDYLVTNVSIDNLNGGLTQIVVNTAGTQNSLTPAKVRLLPNYPLLFGLKGISTEGINPKSNGYVRTGANKPRSGFGIMLTFITKNTTEEEAFVFSNLSNGVLPGEFRGSLLPTPASAPFTQSYDNRSEYSNASYHVTSIYRGFICTETTYQKIGGVILFQLTYKECGRVFGYTCTDGKCENFETYNYE